MPFKQPKAEKLYYSIGEVAEMFDLRPSTIRFWEKEFESLRPHKNKKGNRFFTKEDIEHLGLIYHLVKERGMTLKGAHKKIKENRQGTQDTYEVIRKLQDIKKFLTDIKEEL